jgi:outer membrane protein TolC
LIGAQLSWDLFDGFKKIASIQKSKIALEKAELHLEKYKHQSQLELSKTQRGLIEQEQAILNNELAVEQAREALRITSNRYDQGLEKTAELLKDQTLLLEKQLALKQAYYNYNLSLSQLVFLAQ